MKSKDAKADQDAREGTKSEKADGAEEAKHEPDLKEEEQTEKPVRLTLLYPSPYLSC